MSYIAELYRQRGSIGLRLSDQDTNSGEQDLLRAIEIARQQGAKTYELRASVDLARLWRAQGKCAEARDLLAPIYDWFTEGFDTSDLKDAKALLDELR